MSRCTASGTNLERHRLERTAEMCGTVSATNALITLLPLITIAYLMVGRYWPTTRMMPVAWVVAIGAGVLDWGMTPQWTIASTINGFITASNILYIVFGTILLLCTLKQTGTFDAINNGFVSISEDRRVQVVILVFLMGPFIEAAAGFGTPAAIAGPLLVGLGFPPLAAAVVALTGNFMAITLGMVGTPLIIGMIDILDDVSVITNTLDAQSTGVEQWVSEIAVFAAMNYVVIGVVLPFIGVAMMTRFFGGERSVKPALEVLPLTLFVWASFSVPYFLAAYFLGPVFPGLVGAMVGLLLTVSAPKAGFFHPDEEWDFAPQTEWPDHWTDNIQPGETSQRGDAVVADGGAVKQISPWKAWTPYVLVVALLVVTRVFNPLMSFLTSNLVSEYTDIWGTGLTDDFQLLCLPGAVLLVIHAATIGLHDTDTRQVKVTWAETIEKVAPMVVALLLAVATVQITLQSGNATGIDSMLIVLSEGMADITGGVYPFFAASVGTFGAFLAGSNTVSGTLFDTFQYGVADQIGTPEIVMLGTQVVGGAIGNLIAVHNVVAAFAVVGLVGEEGRVIRLGLTPLLYYETATGVLTLLFSYVLFPGVF